MNALRLVYNDPPGEIPVPDEFRHRPVEIIIMQLEDREKPVAVDSVSSSWLSSFAGSWRGGALVRESQGDFEVREELQ